MINEEGIVAGDVAQYDKKIGKKNKKKKKNINKNDDILKRVEKYIDPEQGEIDNGFSKVDKKKRKK